MGLHTLNELACKPKEKRENGCPTSGCFSNVANIERVREGESRERQKYVKMQKLNSLYHLKTLKNCNVGVLKLFATFLTLKSEHINEHKSINFTVSLGCSNQRFTCRGSLFVHFSDSP